MAVDADRTWTSNSSDVLTIHLTAPSGKSIAAFHPVFTYPFFGDEETIFGYRGLEIEVAFRQDTLEPKLDVRWDERYENAGDMQADDVREALRPLFRGEPTRSSSSEGASLDFSPPGTRVHKYIIGEEEYGIWTARLSDPSARSVLANVQILIPMFIEGGSLIDLDDPKWTIDRWSVYFVYRIGPGENSYGLIGYATAYKLFFLEERSPLYQLNSIDDFDLSTQDESLPARLPSRERISQFLILPPYQAAGHGSRLYNAMMINFTHDAAVSEITVEDPNETFDDMRDVNDILRLRETIPSFRNLVIDTSVHLPSSKTAPVPMNLIKSPQTIEDIRRESRIAGRQLDRLVEMQLLHRIPIAHRSLIRITRKDRASDPNDRAYFFWRLLVKRRLYKHNADSLQQIDIEERVEKLEEALSAVQEHYVRLLDIAAERRLHRPILATKSAESSVIGKARSTKRKIIEDDDDDDDDHDNDSLVNTKDGTVSGKSSDANEAAVQDSHQETSKRMRV